MPSQLLYHPRRDALLTQISNKRASIAAVNYRVESMKSQQIFPIMDDDEFLEEMKQCFYLYLGIKPKTNNN